MPTHEPSERATTRLRKEAKLFGIETAGLGYDELLAAYLDGQLQKLQELGLPVDAFRSADSVQQVEVDNLPFILDGKYVVRVSRITAPRDGSWHYNVTHTYEGETNKPHLAAPAFVRRARSIT